MKIGTAPDLTSSCLLDSERNDEEEIMLISISINKTQINSIKTKKINYNPSIHPSLPICVKFSKAPAAFLWTRESLTLANFNNEGIAPCDTISFLLTSVVANVVIQPQALHWTSGSSVPSKRIRDDKAPALTIVDLFSSKLES